MGMNFDLDVDFNDININKMINESKKELNDLLTDFNKLKTQYLDLSKKYTDNVSYMTSLEKRIMKTDDNTNINSLIKDELKDDLSTMGSENDIDNNNSLEYLAELVNDACEQKRY